MAYANIIKPLVVGVFPNFESSIFLWRRNVGEKMERPILMFVIEAAGKKIVVDTGPSAPAEAAKYHPAIVQKPEMVPLTALKQAGVNPEEVEQVVLTHLHWDHCYNTELFPNATFFVQRRELEFAMAPYPDQEAQYEIGIPGHIPPWQAVRPKMQIVEGDVQDFAKGVHLVSLPGHSPGLMGVAVETSAGVHLIASDHIPLEANWVGDGKMKHIPGAIHSSVEEYYQSFTKIEKIADVVLAAHDFATVRHAQYPYK